MPVKTGEPVARQQANERYRRKTAEIGGRFSGKIGKAKAVAFTLAFAALSVTNAHAGSR